MNDQNINNSFPPTQPPHRSWFSIHHTLAYIILGSLFAAAVAWVYIMQKADNVDVSIPVHQVKNVDTADLKTQTNSKFNK